MATTKITSPDLFDLGSLDSALQLPSGTTAERPTSPSTGEWRFNTDNNLIEFYDGGSWRDLQDEDVPPVPSENFNTVLYTGNGGTQSISSLSFSPSFVWIKRLDATASHFLTFEKEGTGKQWSTNSCAGRTFNTNMITSFDSNGFTLGANSASNDNAGSYAAWCFNVNGGTSVTNTDGTANSSVEVNSKTKISIMTYSGNGFSNSTRGHGLGVAPEFVFTRDQNNANCWYVWHKDLGPISGNNYLQFSTSSQASDTSIWSGTVPNNQVITLGNNINVNGSGRAFITFAMASVAGFSKVGSYTGNGSTDGPIVETGFEPAFLIIKRTDSTSSWIIYDNKRSSSNPREKILYVNLSNAENNSSSNAVDFLTNGFKIKNTSYNANGGTYIYIAFAADPSPAPVLADSFNTNLYTGNGTSQSITGLGFSPSLTWIKQRDAVRGQNWYDVLRGPNNILFSNTTGAQDTTSTEVLQSFDTDGFTLGNLSAVNASGGDYVSWNWKGSTLPTINTEGSVTTLVSANQAAGFSLVFDSAGGPNTYGHGLTQAPEMIIAKTRLTVGDWYVYHKDLNGGSNPAHYFIKLNSTDAEALNGSSGGSIWNSTAPTSTVFSYGTTIGNAIAYCFHSVSGFSKIGSYTGNGGSNSITGLGFQPDWVLIKDATSTGSWFVYDNERTVSVGSNPGTANARPYIIANSSGAENGVTTYNIDLDSDGFSMNTSSTELNDSGQTYIYAAFKENP